ncbi:hypothetical protein M9Y10_013624 [Tritrichomonas musculus]|uniref:RAC family serine/threonine-protein kinase like protein n=1 Tax=Tritrichomonas musculus TaxID=1915356 RepID=A0ABR2KXD5_9EUKA
MAQSYPKINTEPLEGWFSVNNNQRYCRLNDGRIDIASDDKLENLEYSIPLAKIVDSYHSPNEAEFDILPENSPTLHFASSDVESVQKWKNAINDDNDFDYLHQNILKMSDFKLSKIIGGGFSSNVHLVRRKSDGKLFALKLMNKTKLVDSSTIQRMITERNILIQSNFPFITKIHGAFQTETFLVLVLEYVGGGDLQHHLDKGIFFSPKQIKIYLAELVLALEHLHKMGIIFRDLKPSNILIAKDGNIKITDFGLAKNIIESGKTKSLCGTHEYLAPEMLLGNYYGFSVDWWALGVIAYRLICGILPFTNQNLSKLYDKIIDCKYRIPHRIDPDQRDFISGLLKKDPNDRLNIDQIKNHKYFSDVDWQKLYKKEYKLDFVPVMAEDDSAFNFDTSLFQKNQVDSYENFQIEDKFDFESFENNSPNLNCDLNSYSDESFISNFSFSSHAEDFDTDNEND